MKQTFIYIFLIISFLNACTEKKVPMDFGYLQIEGIDLSCEGEILPLSRAVDAGLQVQICQNGQVLEGHDYVPGSDFSKRITLPAGVYTVKAFTPDQAEAANDELGHPVYSVISDEFTVVDGDLTTVSLVVPQINVGVKVTFEASFLAVFTDISVKVTSASGREITIDNTSDETYRYFSFPRDGKLNYVVNATNADGESFKLSKEINGVEAKNYTLHVGIE